MSRRDTIIIAVLVNAGLLIVLFATAMRSDKKQPIEKLTLADSQQVLESPITRDSLPSVDDQMDALLNQYAMVPTLGSPSASEELLFSSDDSATILAQDATPTLGEVILPTPSQVEVLASAQSSSSQPSPRVLTVTVKKGDVLEKIAKVNGSTVSGIMKANNLSSTQLKIGQVLKVPTKEGNAPLKNSTSSFEGEYYTVKDGDSPWLIASKNHVKLEELLRLNNLDEAKAKRLRPGDRLKIR